MFNLIVLILVTIVFLMFGYLITHVDIFSPFCVFCEMFLIAEFLCLFFSRMYKVEIHLNTILVIALGMISFGIVSAFFYMKRVDVRNYGEQHSRNYISINYLIQLVFLILEVLVVFYHASIVSLWVKILNLECFFSLVISSLLFFGAYGFVLLILKEELFLEIFNTIKNKII